MFKKEELNGWLVKVGSQVEKPIKIYMIGGGALSFRELKESTKDIDLIVTSKEDFDVLDKAIQKAGFELKTDLEEEFYLTALAVYMGEGDSRIDVFLKQVGKMLTITKGMIQRATPYQSYGKLDAYLISSEDIFLFKSMSSREGDIKDSDRLSRKGLNYDAVYDEIIEQSKIGNKWFFWVYESLCRLEEFSGIPLPIKDKVFDLVREHWKDKPSDFMEDIKDLDKHIPDKKLLGEVTSNPKNLQDGLQKGLKDGIGKGL